MIYLRCECDNGLGVPGSFRNEPATCDECGRALRLVAAHDLDDRQAPKWRLEVASAPGGFMQGEHVLLGGTDPIEVGSDEGKHLRLLGQFVSPHHGWLVPSADGWSIEDAGGPNGVFVNAKRVSSAALRPGDVLRIGGYELHYAPAGRSATATPRPPVRVPPPPPRRAATAPQPASKEVEELEEVELEEIVADDHDDYGAEYELADEPPPPPTPGRRAVTTVAAADVPFARLAPAPPPPPPVVPGPPCPSCGRTLVAGARICVDCGINVRSGRPLLTAQGLDEDTMVVRAENTIRLISWVIPLGLYPIGSEARGHEKPYAVWSIAALTVLVSFIFFGFMWAAAPAQLPAGAQLMLWAGSQHAAEARTDALLDELQDAERTGEVNVEQAIELHQLLERPTLKLEPHQLLTHALLHGDLLHLAGNLLFLLVLGTRVNALLGNAKTAVIYPVLAVAGAVAHLIAMRDRPSTPMLGASGAIMGLAGMYLVFFPAYRVHMAAWVRLIFTLFRLGLKIFTVRGFWVVLFYIAFDVVATAVGSEDNVAHWAHLGGFLTGVAIALLLLVTRTVHAHGGDVLSVALGKYAWPLLGRPQPYRRAEATSVGSNEVTSPAA